jgi:hypothetical protein
MKIARLASRKGGAVIEMELLVGPLLQRNGGYSYDTFTSAEGLRHSFRYLRIEAARYDQRALVAEARRDPRWSIHTCETQSEFERLVREADAEGAIPRERGKQD